MLANNVTAGSIGISLIVAIVAGAALAAVIIVIVIVMIDWWENIR